MNQSASVTKKGYPNQVFYRKWRPQTLEEVVGQEHITQTLHNALEQGHIAHAYLFCGPRGTGKTSTGRIVAKAVNCLGNGGRGEPCNKCEMCAAISQGKALDVIEVDAASNRRIEEVRDLRERIRFAPNSARYKVYIIDEVHMLTKEASNALLKTLEEPPGYVIFILATTEPHKLLATTLSRCQRFDFRRLPLAATVAKLNYICKEENITIDSQALHLITKAAGGSLRDAENLLEQLVIHYGYQINGHQTQELLGITSDFRVKELARCIIHKDTATGLATINNIVNDGLDLSQFHQALVEHLRNMLLISSGAEEITSLTPEEQGELRELSRGIPLGEILGAVKTFAQINFRENEYSPLPLELALVEYSLPANGEDAPPPPEAERARAKPVSQLTISPDIRRQETETPLPKVEATAPIGPAEKALVPECHTAIERIRAEWGDFVNTLRGMGSNRNLDAFLRSACEPAEVQDDTLVLKFRYGFHRDKIADPKYRHLVEKKLAEKFTTPHKIQCILEPQAKQKATEGHLVKEALKMGARIVSVEEK